MFRLAEFVSVSPLLGDGARCQENGDARYDVQVGFAEWGGTPPSRSIFRAIEREYRIPCHS
jgi:hypothetical protein